MDAAHKAQLAPNARRLPSADDLLLRLQRVLDEKYCLEPLPEFTIVVEGKTDRDYLVQAAQLARDEHGEELLAVPAHLSESATEIAVVTPLHAESRNAADGRERGGIPQVVRLADDLRSYVFTLEVFRGLLFVFDHDKAGFEAQEKMREFGYRPGQHSITLDPKEHVGSCAKKQVVIEDLLSLRVQKKFFDCGHAWCSVDYEEGRIVRFQWGHESKHLLRDYVCKHATWADLREVGRVLARARAVFGFPVNGDIFR